MTCYNTSVFTWSLLQTQLFANRIYENLYSLQLFVCKIIWSFYISFLYDQKTFWRIFEQKRKYLSFFYIFFLKCTLFSHIFMKTSNTFYGSAWMLKFKNDFTKPLSLQRNHKDTYSFTLFYIFKNSTLLFVFYIILCVTYGSEKKIRFF